ncbi:10613_t:CDS:2, partial [Gigaspora rosea]
MRSGLIKSRLYTNIALEKLKLDKRKEFIFSTKSNEQEEKRTEIVRSDEHNDREEPETGIATRKKTSVLPVRNVK